MTVTRRHYQQPGKALLMHVLGAHHELGAGICEITGTRHACRGIEGAWPLIDLHFRPMDEGEGMPQIGQPVYVVLHGAQFQEVAESATPGAPRDSIVSGARL